METDLLIKIARDMSKILIEDGKMLFEENKFELALTYFQYPYSLVNKAFEHDRPFNASDIHRPSIKYRQILDDLIGKFQQAMS
ncbi:hypothetical protein I4U23_005404 [Adineta vaga]|nr:hypothetical protein I4U23_005404 [Adineta vaga]